MRILRLTLFLLLGLNVYAQTEFHVEVYDDMYFHIAFERYIRLDESYRLSEATWATFDDQLKPYIHERELFWKEGEFLRYREISIDSGEETIDSNRFISQADGNLLVYLNPDTSKVKVSYVHTGEYEFSQIYQDQVIWTINLDPDNLWVRHDSNGGGVAHYTFDRNGVWTGIYNEDGPMADVSYEDNCYTVTTKPFEGMSRTYKIYVPESHDIPDDIMVQAFNVFVSNLGNNRYFIPFIIGYY